MTSLNTAGQLKMSSGCIDEIGIPIEKASNDPVNFASTSLIRRSHDKYEPLERLWPLFIYPIAQACMPLDAYFSVGPARRISNDSKKGRSFSSYPSGRCMHVINELSNRSISFEIASNSWLTCGTSE